MASLSLKRPFCEGAGSFSNFTNGPKCSLSVAWMGTGHWLMLRTPGPRPLQVQVLLLLSPSPFLGQEGTDSCPLSSGSLVLSSFSLRGRPQEPPQDVERCK